MDGTGGASVHDDLARGFGLAGRVAVVTGAASGIGRDAALLLARAGAKVVLADRAADAVAAAAAEIASEGHSAIHHPTDVSDRAAVGGLAARALAEHGRIDIWVNAAGIILNRPILETEQEDLDRILAVNLNGVFWGCAAAGRAMKAGGGGAIVNISSGGGESAVPGLALYSMSKAAVNMLTRTVAAEFGPFGVRANTISPGFIETPMVSYRFIDANGAIDPALRDEVMRQRASVSPIGLTGAPRDIAFAVLYLVSDASRFVTGQILRPNGGVAMP